MRRALLAGALGLAVLLPSDAAAQCAGALYPPNYAESLSFDAGYGVLTSQVNEAINSWTGACGQAGSHFPAMLANSGAATYSFSVSLTAGANPGTSQTGFGCGYFQPTTNSSGVVIGGTIVLYDARSDSSDCEPSRAETIAHEMGHALGLSNSECVSYMMGPPITGGTRSVHSDECQEADTLWTTPAEVPSGGGGCEGTILNPGEDCSPIIINLGRGDYRLTGPNRPVLFDIAASGWPIQISWTAAGADEAFLWLDRNHNGVADDGGELFGNSTSLMSGRRARNGFEALQEFDTNQDDVIDRADPIWSRLQLWWDFNHDGVSQPGEVQPISNSDVIAISLVYHWTGRRDSFGNTFRYEALAWLKSAEPRSTGTRATPVYDIFFVRVK